MSKIKLPEGAGPEVTVTLAGQEPKTYKASRGYIEVDDSDAIRVSAAIPGSDITASSNPEPAA